MSQLGSPRIETTTQHVFGDSFAPGLLRLPMPIWPATPTGVCRGAAAGGQHDLHGCISHQHFSALQALFTGQRYHVALIQDKSIPFNFVWVCFDLHWINFAFERVHNLRVAAVIACESRSMSSSNQGISAVAAASVALWLHQNGFDSVVPLLEKEMSVGAGIMPSSVAACNNRVHRQKELTWRPEFLQPAQNSAKSILIRVLRQWYAICPPLLRLRFALLVTSSAD